MNIVFITGCANSGATSLLKVLELSRDVHGLMEPIPNLDIVSREQYEGRLNNPYKPLTQLLGSRIATGLNKKSVHIEKQLSLVPFMINLSEIFNCRFIIPIRDGREVARSIIDWHNQTSPNFYKECRELPKLSGKALNASGFQTGTDSFDFSLPRPSLNDPWHEGWANFTRFEMASWYWNSVNLFIIRQLNSIDQSRYLMVDCTEPEVEIIRKVYDFIGLSDFNEQEVASAIYADNASLKEGINPEDYFPHWKEWSEEQFERFFDIAIDGMRALGFDKKVIRKKPQGFGKWWLEKERDANWYKEIYDYRPYSHEIFKKWFVNINQRVDNIESIIDVGCGISYGYQDLFKDHDYIGIDLSKHAIQFAATQNQNSRHKYLCSDIIQETANMKADLVFSQGSIDNVYDMDAFLRSMARMSNSLLYINNYRGYFKSMERHRYLWDPSMRVFFNDISPIQIENVLSKEGFKTILIFPQITNRDDIHSETTIIASRKELPENDLMVHQDISFEFKDYIVKPSELTHDQIVDAVNKNCSNYSENGLDLVNSLEYYEKILDDLQNLSDLRLGSMEELATNRSEVNIGLRVDVDMDVVAARDMAKIANRKSIVLSFYILHTASYYGDFSDGIFRRNEKVAIIYKELEELDSEIGLHIDPLMIYLELNIDGAQAIATELAWLRSLGIKVRGTSSHNAAPVYGAENFEIFKERKVRKSSHLIRDYTYVPLGILSEEELELTYEAGSPKPPISTQDERRRFLYLKGLPSGDFLRSKEWFRRYIVDNPHNSWGYNYHIWIIGKDTWAVGGRNRLGQEVFFFDINWNSVMNFLSFVNKDEKVAFTLHPIYFGKRNEYGASPDINS